MKATKAILAIAVVAVMVLVPLSVVDVDAAKTPAVDSSSGYYVKNDGNITEALKFVAVDGMDSITYIIGAHPYINSDFLNLLAIGMPSSLEITTYEKDKYNSLKGTVFDQGNCTIINGKVTLNLKSVFTSAYLFNAASDAPENDLLKKANEYFGIIPAGKTVTVTSEVSFKILSKSTTEFAEAKDKYVAKSSDEYSYVASVSTATFTYGEKSVSMDCSFTEKKNMKTTYDCDVDTSTAAPAFCNVTEKATDDISDCALKGTVNGEKYSNDIESKMKATAEVFVKENTKDAVRESTSCLEDINAENISLADDYGKPTEAVAQQYLKGLGFNGESDYSKAKSNVDDVFNSFKSADENVWIWVLAAVFVALIAIVVIVIKK